MAAAREIVEQLQQTDENATNGDANLKLEYSGLSEESLGVSSANKSVADDIAQDFHEDLDEHGVPNRSTKAVKRDINDSHILSDDECPKTLTTLETVKKPAQPNEPDEVEICPIEAEDDEFGEEEEEEPILLEVIHDDEENNKESDSADSTKVAIIRKPQIETMANNVKTKILTPKAKLKANNDSIVTPHKPIPTPSAGTIEIPRELITSDVNVISPVIINHIKNPLANSDDLIAILEGDDNGSVNIGTSSIEHYELALSSGNTNGEKKLPLTAEEEREIAMEQILSLPKKKKGRPKLNPALKAARDARLMRKPKNAALVNSLVSEWDENEAKHDDTIETEIVVEIRPQKKQSIVAPIEPSFRRSRIIKKKIIWDPDAPETAINYASLAHTSGAGPLRKSRKPNAKKQDTDPIEDTLVDTEVTIPLNPTPKKKKSSEIDKLLGDEGAANMLNSLNQGNNNNNKVDGQSPGKISRAKSIKVEPCNVQNAIPLSAKAKATKIKEAKEQTLQKPPQTAKPKTTATPKSVAAGKKRGPKTSESWDYIYKSRPDDCMIIRRRSNSSYSSNASLNRTSIDLPNAPYDGADFDGVDNEHELEPQPKRSRSNKDKNFEFAKPKAKKIGKADNETKYQTTFDEAKNFDNINNVFTNHKPTTNVQSEQIDLNSLPVKLENGTTQDTSFTQISVSRFEHFSQIIFERSDVDTKSLLTVQVSWTQFFRF